jgi:HEAT repeat protein
MLKRRDIATTPALLEALGQLRSRAAGPLIIKNLRHPAPSIRQAAIVALAQIADPAAIRPLRKQRKKEAPPLSWSIEAALRQISLAHKIKIFWGWF